MRVAFSIFKYFPYGGIQRDLMKLVDECRQRDMAVRIYAAKWLAPMPGASTCASHPCARSPIT
jgi:UDP-glucose:(heptosyl)LPS alpha-1,3-glucosyltransferase